MPTALIFGVTGQDGAYLARLLLQKGYEVIGAVRAGRAPFVTNLRELGLENGVQMRDFDYADAAALRQGIAAAQPDEIYNLAAQSSVARSFESPVETGEIDALFVTRLLQGIREAKPDARFFQASSSEIFGEQSGLLSESSPLRPANPYGTAKAYAHWITGNFRDAFGLHASCGILFNHESPLRAAQFVTRKITLGAAKIKLGQQSELLLGNLEVQRDWGFAGDYVEAMWKMVQADSPSDFVIATGQLHWLHEWVELAFSTVGLDHREFVRSDSAFLRPTDAAAMAADPSKAANLLGWRAKMAFADLVGTMVEADLRRVQRGEA